MGIVGPGQGKLLIFDKLINAIKYVDVVSVCFFSEDPFVRIFNLPQGVLRRHHLNIDTD